MPSGRYQRNSRCQGHGPLTETPWKAVHSRPVFTASCLKLSPIEPTDDKRFTGRLHSPPSKLHAAACHLDGISVCTTARNLVVAYMVDEPAQTCLKAARSQDSSSHCCCGRGYFDSPGSQLLEPSNLKGLTYEGWTYVKPPIGRHYLPDYIIKHVNANWTVKDLRRRCLPMISVLPMSGAVHAANGHPLLLIVLSSLFFIGRFAAGSVVLF